VSNRQTPRTTRHLSKQGKIIYRIDHPDFADGVWGHENFVVTRHANGDRVLRAYCELNDNPAIIRDVIQRVDTDFHPMEAMIRLTEGDEFKGSAWYHFTDTSAECQGYNTIDGRIEAKMDITRNVRGFGNHSLLGDGWLVAKFDRSKGLGRQTFHNNPITSIDHRGATGPSLEATTSSSLEYFGEEDIEVTAGRFRCHHFAFVLMSNDHPPYHLWVTADGDFIFIKGTVAAPYNWSFELIEYHES